MSASADASSGSAWDEPVASLTQPLNRFAAGIGVSFFADAGAMIVLVISGCCFTLSTASKMSAHSAAAGKSSVMVAGMVSRHV